MKIQIQIVHRAIEAPELMSAADIKTVVHVCESYIHIIICILVGMGWVGIHFGTGVATALDRNDCVLYFEKVEPYG